MTHNRGAPILEYVPTSIEEKEDGLDKKAPELSGVEHGLRFMVTLSHDAGVVVGVVLALQDG